MALLQHSLLVIGGDLPGDLSSIVVERLGRLLLEYATIATAASSGGLRVSLSIVPAALGGSPLVRALPPVSPAGLIHFMLSGAGASALRSLAAADPEVGHLGPLAPTAGGAVAAAIEALCNDPVQEGSATPHLISVLSFGAWAMPSRQLQDAVLRASRLGDGPSTARVEFIRFVVCDAESGSSGLDALGSAAPALSGDAALRNSGGRYGGGGAADLRALAQSAAAAAAATASRAAGGGEAVPAFLRQVTRMLPRGAQDGAAADWLRERGDALLPVVSPLQALPLVAAAQVSAGPPTLLALAHTWLALAAPARLCVVSTAAAAPRRLPVPQPVGPTPAARGDWWLESSLGDDDGGSAPTAVVPAVAWLPGWRPGCGPDGGSCVSVGALPILLSDAGGSRSLDDLGPRIRAAVAALGIRQAAEERERRTSGRPAKQPARWKGKAAEAAAAARVDVHLCWQRVADALLAGPPAELRAVCLVQLASLPLQYLMGGGCFQATVPPPPPPSHAGGAAALGGSDDADELRTQAAGNAAEAWRELLAALVAAGCGVLLRGPDTPMPLSCAGGGSSTEEDVPVLIAWYVLLPGDSSDSESDGAGAGAVAPASQALLYRIAVRDALAGSAACSALGLRAFPASASSSGASVASCGGGALAGSGLAPASTYQALPLGTGSVPVDGAPPAAVAVSAILQTLLVASQLSPLDFASGVGVGHRALVARVDLATAFASGVVAASLGDVLQPPAPGAAHPRARKAPSVGASAASAASAPLAPGSPSADADMGVDGDADGGSGGDGADFARESLPGGPPASPAAAAAPRKRADGARTQPLPLPPPPAQQQQQPAAAAFLAQVVRSRQQQQQQQQQQQGGARSPSPGPAALGSSRGAPAAAAPKGRQAAGSASSRQRKPGKAAAAASAAAPPPPPHDLSSGQNPRGGRRVSFYAGSGGAADDVPREGEGDEDDDDCIVIAPPPRPRQPYTAPASASASRAGHSGGGASAFREPLRSSAPPVVVCCDSESEDGAEGAPYCQGDGVGAATEQWEGADGEGGALPSLGGLDCEALLRLYVEEEGDASVPGPMSGGQRAEEDSSAGAAAGAASVAPPSPPFSSFRGGAREQRANTATKRRVSERWQDSPAEELPASPLAPRKAAPPSLQQQQRGVAKGAKGGPPLPPSRAVDPVIAGLLGPAGRAAAAACGAAPENDDTGYGEGAGAAADFAFDV